MKKAVPKRFQYYNFEDAVARNAEAGIHRALKYSSTINLSDEDILSLSQHITNYVMLELGEMIDFDV